MKELQINDFESHTASQHFHKLPVRYVPKIRQNFGQTPVICLRFQLLQTFIQLFLRDGAQFYQHFSNVYSLHFSNLKLPTSNCIFNQFP